MKTRKKSIIILIMVDKTPKIRKYLIIMKNKNKKNRFTNKNQKYLNFQIMVKNQRL